MNNQAPHHAVVCVCACVSVCGFWQAAGNDRGQSIEAHEEKKKQKRKGKVCWINTLQDKT